MLKIILGKISKSILAKLVLAGLVSSSLLTFSVSDIDLGDIDEMELRESVSSYIKETFKPLDSYKDDENYEINYEFSDYMNGNY